MKLLKLRPVLLMLPLFVAIGLLAYQIEIAFPATPNIHSTFTPFTAATPQELGSYDVLGQAVSKAEATELIQAQEGARLSPDN